MVTDGVHSRSTNGLAQLVARHSDERGLRLVAQQGQTQPRGELVITVLDSSSAATCGKWPGAVIGESKVPLARLWTGLVGGKTVRAWCKTYDGRGAKATAKTSGEVLLRVQLLGAAGAQMML